MDTYLKLSIVLLNLHYFCPIETATVSHNTRILVNELQKTLSPQIPLHSPIYNFSKDELFWINWLKANDFNLDKTRAQFLEHLKWRQINSIDFIHTEDWSFFESEYPAYTDSVDKMGRPIIELWLSDWNFRKAVMTGHSKKLVKWSVKMMEMEMRKLYELREGGKRNISGGIEIIDFAGLNMWQHGCAICVSIYRNMGETLDQQYPGVIGSIYIVNVAPTFQYFLQLWRQNLLYSSKKLIQGYGEKHEWLDVLNDKIDKDQRSVRFGGIKIREE